MITITLIIIMLQDREAWMKSAGQSILQDLLTGCDFSCDSELAPFYCMSDGGFLSVQITLWLYTERGLLTGTFLKRAKPEMASAFISPASSLVAT